jgi:hypothetical protein
LEFRAPPPPTHTNTQTHTHTTHKHPYPLAPVQCPHALAHTLTERGGKALKKTLKVHQNNKPHTKWTIDSGQIKPCYWKKKRRSEMTTSDSQVTARPFFHQLPNTHPHKICPKICSKLQNKQRNRRETRGLCCSHGSSISVGSSSNHPSGFSASSSGIFWGASSSQSSGLVASGSGILCNNRNCTRLGRSSSKSCCTVPHCMHYRTSSP